MRRGGLKRVLFIKLVELGIALLMNVVEKIRQLFLSQIPCLAMHCLEFAPVNSHAFSSKEGQILAQASQCSAHPCEGLRVLVAHSSDSCQVGGELLQQPQQLELALACVLALATGAPRM